MNWGRPFDLKHLERRMIVVDMVFWLWPECQKKGNPRGWPPALQDIQGAHLGHTLSSTLLSRGDLQPLLLAQSSCTPYLRVDTLGFFTPRGLHMDGE